MGKSKKRSSLAKAERLAPVKVREEVALQRLPLREIAAAASIFLALLVVYGPALHGGFLWDDNAHVTAPELRSLRGLWRIWFDLGATQQYYPFLYTVFWVEHKLWGDAVLGYHLANLFLHATAACLLVIILRRLSVTGAWLAGLLFALHPVCVEAVAWISEQKSTLSTVFYLGSALAYLDFDQTRRKMPYVLALGLFVLALLSKSVTATLPAGLLLVFWWRRGSLDAKRDVAPLIPWFALGVTSGLFTAWVERTIVGAKGPDYALSLLERFLLAGRVIWFYLGKLAWPANLIFIYPHWKIDRAVWWQYLFPVGVLGAAFGIWLVTRPRRGPLAGFLFFCGTLFPVLGFLNVYPFVFSYVADHFQYLASVGIIVPVASGMVLASERIRMDSRQAYALGGLILVVLGILSRRQAAMYQDAETLFQETLVRNPDCWMAQNNLGITIAETPGRLPEAVDHLQAALRIEPKFALAHYNLGRILSSMPGRMPEAIEHYQAALRIQPDYPEVENNLGIAVAAIPGRVPEAMAHFETALRLKPDSARAHYNLGLILSKIPDHLPEAIEHYQAALRIDPEYTEAHKNLGSILASVPGRLPEAVSHYETVIRIHPDDPEAHANLGVALLQIPGREGEAIPHFEMALRQNPDSAETHCYLGIALATIPDRLQDAIAQFQEALRLQPDFEEARQMIKRLRESHR